MASATGSTRHFDPLAFSAMRQLQSIMRAQGAHVEERFAYTSKQQRTQMLDDAIGRSTPGQPVAVFTEKENKHGGHRAMVAVVRLPLAENDFKLYFNADGACTSPDTYARLIASLVPHHQAPSPLAPPAPSQLLPPGPRATLGAASASVVHTPPGSPPPYDADYYVLDASGTTVEVRSPRPMRRTMSANAVQPAMPLAPTGHELVLHVLQHLGLPPIPQILPTATTREHIDALLEAGGNRVGLFVLQEFLDENSFVLAVVAPDPSDRRRDKRQRFILGEFVAEPPSLKINNHRIRNGDDWQRFVGIAPEAMVAYVPRSARPPRYAPHDIQ